MSRSTINAYARTHTHALAPKVFPLKKHCK